MTALANPTSPALDDSLTGAPPLYLTPATRPSLAEAQAWCKTLTTTHYENFHVATFFLPAELRPHFHSVYAFCRTSDDLGDEVADTATATRLLATWRHALSMFLRPNRLAPPRLRRLQPTIAERNLPIQPFDDLISAFEQDQVYTHHESLATLEQYSRYSANPVGRLVLLVSGYQSEELMQLSDESAPASSLQTSIRMSSKTARAAAATFPPTPCSASTSPTNSSSSVTSTPTSAP